MTLSTGTILNNRYRIVKLLGQGGMGAVYRAWDLNLELSVALKENLDPDPQATAQFKREARLLANLKHNHLPRVIDYFAVGLVYYLVMDYIDGEDLQSLVQREGKQPEAKVLDWILQVADALVYLHSQTPPVIHRDIKPANIRVTPAGQAYLVDFGIAKLFELNLATTQGARAVTPLFSPLEQYGKGSTDARSDVYALGATAYVLLTGKEPPESIERANGTALTPPRALVPHISANTEMAVLHALEIFQPQRYQTMAEFAAALKAPQPAPVQIPVPQKPISAPAPAQIPVPPQPILPASPPRVEKDGMQMVYVPAGPFLMGSLDSDSQAKPNEKPQHRVELDGYWIDKTPVTNAMFAQFVQATGYKTEAEQAGSKYGWDWRHPEKGSDLKGKMDRPVVYVTLFDAQAYCQWVGRRLPTEAEWEKAARGTDGRLYPWGNEAPDSCLCSFGMNLGAATPVGLFSPLGDSPYGCVDMAGNVEEWVADWYNQDYYRHSPSSNPKGLGGGTYGITRGGSYITTWDFVRCAFRRNYEPKVRYSGTGFRCAR